MDNAIQSIGDIAVSRAFAARPNISTADTARIERTAQDFESMFASQMLQPMFQSVNVNSTFGGGHGEEVMRGFLVQEYGKMMATHNQLGIAEGVKTEMIRAQEISRTQQSMVTSGDAHG